MFDLLTCGDSDIDGVDELAFDDAGPRAVVPVKVGLLDADVAVVFPRVAQVQHCVVIIAVTFIVVAII